ncbi:hypothetical protein Daus18300_012736 [Diaporthe australafricana]|uniref:Uncharacterized protein n=1 Tax=Diaporthe australafricana TaxID=127596 RepID=A0ABR3W1N3_9PEZI
MANIRSSTGAYPPQLILPPSVSILESFDYDMPHYDYAGKAYSASLSNFTTNTRPPRYGVQRPISTTQPAPGAQPVPNLWQDIGNRHLQRIKDNLSLILIELQPIWQQIQQTYDGTYDLAFRNASGNQAPGNFPQAHWNQMNQAQRNIVAERVGEQAGKAAVADWKRREEAILFRRVGGTTALAPYAQSWITWNFNYMMEQEHIYHRERASQHFNESDVVRTAAMYLVHPVVAAMDADQTTYGGVLLQSEDSARQVRSDMTFYRYTYQGRNRRIAVLEFKRRGVIRPNQFADAMPAAAPAFVLPGNTLFRGEAGKLMKQASAYAMRYETRHVAVCDWSYLVLCYFADMPYNAPNTIGNRVEVQIIPIGNAGPRNQLDFYNSLNSRLFRPALLGFIKHAYDNTPP